MRLRDIERNIKVLETTNKFAVKIFGIHVVINRSTWHSSYEFARVLSKLGLVW